MRAFVSFQLALAGLVVCAAGALAGPVTFQFEGTVTQVLDDNGLLGGSVRVGTPFWGEYTFESTTPDSEPGDPTLGFYEDVLISLFGEVGGFPFSAAGIPSSRIYVVNDEPFTGFDSYNVLANVDFVGHTVQFGLGLGDTTGEIFSSDALPLVPPLVPAGFGVGSQASGVSISGDLTSFVPEPGSLALFALLAGAVVGRRCGRTMRRARRRRAGARKATMGALCLLPVLARPTLAEGDPVCGCTDIGFIVDVTASMRGAVIPPEGRVPDQLAQIVDLALARSGGDLRLGLVTFGDTIKVRHVLTHDIDSVLCTLNSLTIETGGQPEEPSDEALREVLSGTVCNVPTCLRWTPFRSECIKHAILITDNPPAGCDDDFDPGVDTVNAHARADEAAAAGVMVSAVYVVTAEVPGWCPNETCGIMYNYAARTHGIFAEVPETGLGIAAALQPKFDQCPDCNENGVNDLCDLSCGVPGVTCPSPGCGTKTDCQPNGVPDDCEADCNYNELPDSCDIAAGASKDCDETFVPDECELGSSPPNCDGDEIPDACEISCGAGGSFCTPGTCGQSNDCNDNCVPDECESSTDCQPNGVPDICDIAAGTSPDVLSYPSDCCVAKCEAGCDVLAVEECVCALAPACCTTQWTESCADVAWFVCPSGCSVQGANGIPDECEITADCNGNCQMDAIDIAQEASADCNKNGTPDECELSACQPDEPACDDCNVNGVLDECDLRAGASSDLDGNCVPDECAACCTNGTCENSLPVNCQEPGGFFCGVACGVDCACAVGACCDGSWCYTPSDDCQCVASGHHFVSGATCETDAPCETGSCCTGPDQCRDWRYSECDPTDPDDPDCCQPDGTYCMDEQACSLIPGGVYVGGARCSDSPGGAWGGRPQAVAAPPEPEELNLPEAGYPVNKKNRFLSIRAGTPGQSQAIRVILGPAHDPPNNPSVPEPFYIWAGQEFYAGEPRQYCENAGQGPSVTPQDQPNGCGSAPGVYANGQDWFWAAPLVCDPFSAHYVDWRTLADYCNTPGDPDYDGRQCASDDDCGTGTCGVSRVVHLFHEGIVPSHMVSGAGPIGQPPEEQGEAVYDIQAIDAECNVNYEASYSAPLTMSQAGWGDVNENVAQVPNGPPNESVGMESDVVGLLNKFSNVDGAMQKARTDLVPCRVDFNIGIPDVVAVLGAFSGGDYENTCGTGECLPGSGGVLLCHGGPNHGMTCTTHDDCSFDLCESGREAAAGGGATGGSTPTPGATATLTLTTSETTAKLGDTMDVHVFASGIKDLRAYEVKLRVDGGTDGELTLADLRIDTERADYVFSGLKEVHATDLSGSRIGGALVSGGIEVEAPAYLGTYTFKPSAKATGVFSVSIDTDSGTPLLMDAVSLPVQFDTPSALQVTVSE